MNVTIIKSYDVQLGSTTMTNLRVDFGDVVCDVTCPHNPTEPQIIASLVDYYNNSLVTPNDPYAGTAITLPGDEDADITNKEIWERMTAAEKQALMEYAGAGQWIRDCFLQDLAMYTSFRRDNPRLVDYLNKMHTAGILADGRAEEILA